MMIFGRSPNLVLGFLSAVLNGVIAFHIAGFNPDLGQIAVLNTILFSLVAVIANTSSIAIAAGHAAATRIQSSK